MCWTFQPDDLFIIDYISKRLSRQQLQAVPVVDANVYTCEPDLLPWDFPEEITKRVRYYYFKRERSSREIPASNAVGGWHGGWWKATTGSVDIFNGADIVVGYKRSLTFRRFTDQHRNRNLASKTNWIMWEYFLPHNQKWILCKMTRKSQPQSNTHDESGASSSDNRRLIDRGSYVDMGGQQHPQPQIAIPTQNVHRITIPTQDVHQITIPSLNVHQNFHMHPLNNNVYPQPDVMEEASHPPILGFWWP